MDLKAKRSAVLQALKQDLSKGFIEEEVEIDGHKFVLRTLSEDSEVWSDSFIRVSSSISILSSRKAPRLAAAIKSIDGVSAEHLFEYPDDMDGDQKKSLNDNPIQKKYWIYTQMLYFLSDETSRPFINKLWEAFDKLEDKREEGIKEIVPL